MNYLLHTKKTARNLLYAGTGGNIRDKYALKHCTKDAINSEEIKRQLHCKEQKGKHARKQNYTAGKKGQKKKHRKKVKGDNFCKRRDECAERENRNFKKLQGDLKHLIFFNK